MTARVARFGAVLVALFVLSVSSVLLYRWARDSSPSKEGPRAEPTSSGSPTVASPPAPAPSRSTPIPTLGADGRIHFASAGNELRFSYPKEWEQSSGNAEGGSFYNVPVELIEQDLPGDMKFEFHIIEDFESRNFKELKDEVCDPSPVVKKVLECGSRELNGYRWVWNAVRYGQIEDVDNGYGVSIHTIADGRLFVMAGVIFRDEGVSAARIDLLNGILESAHLNV